MKIDFARVGDSGGPTSGRNGWKWGFSFGTKFRLAWYPISTDFAGDRNSDPRIASARHNVVKRVIA